MSEQKAKDTLKERSPRRIVGERLVARVGARGWQRPSWAPSARLFEIYRLGDPWDPTQGRQRSVGLGPVNLRLGEQRRQPAPHLKPRQPKAPPAPPAPRVPRAPQPAPAPPPATPVGPPPGETGFFGNTRGHRPLKGALPVRPGATAQQQAAAPSPRPAPPSTPDDVPPRSLPGLPPPRARGARRGRVSMRAAPTRAPAAFEEVPVVAADAPAESAPTAVVDATAEQARAPEPEAPQRKIPTGAMGLDDIFGGAADAGSRVRMGRRKKSDD